MPTEGQEGATVRIDHGRISWVDDEVGTTVGVPVVILPNGWIHTPETGCYYPPTEVLEVSAYERGGDDGE